VGIALRTNEGKDIEAKLVLGQGQAPFRFGPVRFVHLGTRWIEAAPNLEGEPHDGLQGRDGAVVVVGGPHGVTAAWTLAHNRLQGLREGWGRSGCSTGHRYHRHRSRLGNNISMASRAL
jgi:hypothetical protein